MPSTAFERADRLAAQGDRVVHRLESESVCVSAPGTPCVDGFGAESDDEMIVGYLRTTFAFSRCATVTERRSKSTDSTSPSSNRVLRKQRAQRRRDVARLNRTARHFGKHRREEHVVFAVDKRHRNIRSCRARRSRCCATLAPAKPAPRITTRCGMVKAGSIRQTAWFAPTHATAGRHARTRLR